MYTDWLSVCLSVSIYLFLPFLAFLAFLYVTICLYSESVPSAVGDDYSSFRKGEREEEKKENGQWCIFLVVAIAFAAIAAVVVVVVGRFFGDKPRKWSRCVLLPFGSFRFDWREFSRLLYFLLVFLSLFFSVWGRDNNTIPPTHKHTCA